MCSIEDCKESGSKRGWCNKHYLRWWKYGDVNTVFQTGAKPGVKKGGATPGNANPGWIGDNVKYAGQHHRLYTARGKAKDFGCEHCSNQAQHWAYDHTDPDEHYEMRDGYLLPFSTDLERYLPLCRSCHATFD